MKRKTAAPRELVAYRLDIAGEDLVVFTWEPTSGTAALTKAEGEVLALVLDGKKNAEIARTRGVSARTVANQIASLLRKVGVGSRYELIGRVTKARRTK